jgi:hypothetical protein
MHSDLLWRSWKIVAAVKLAQWLIWLMARLDRFGFATEVAQRGVLACPAGCGGAQVGLSVGIGARPSYSVRFVVPAGCGAAHDLSFQVFPGTGGQHVLLTLGASNVLV